MSADPTPASRLIPHTSHLITSSRVASPPPRPLLIYDGECDFCCRCVARFRRRTGERVDFAPLQDAALAQRFPEVPRAACEEAVHYIEPDGRVTRGAEASFLALASCGGVLRWPLRVYGSCRPAAAIAECGYRFIARHRMFFSKWTRWILK